jgi:hypothetical protein
MNILELNLKCTYSTSVFDGIMKPKKKSPQGHKKILCAVKENRIIHITATGSKKKKPRAEGDDVTSLCKNSLIFISYNVKHVF